jgi:hypothetical protein
MTESTIVNIALMVPDTGDLMGSGVLMHSILTS